MAETGAAAAAAKRPRTESRILVRYDPDYGDGDGLMTIRSGKCVMLTCDGESPAGPAFVCPACGERIRKDVRSLVEINSRTEGMPVVQLFTQMFALDDGRWPPFLTFGEFEYLRPDTIDPVTGLSVNPLHAVVPYFWDRAVLGTIAISSDLILRKGLVWTVEAYAVNEFITLPADVYPFPGVVSRLHIPTDSDTIALIRAHIRKSSLVHFVDTAHIRKNTRFNIVTAEQLYTEVAKTTCTGVALIDLLPENDNIYNDVKKLVAANRVFLHDGRVYCCSIAPMLPEVTAAVDLSLSEHGPAP